MKKQKNLYLTVEALRLLKLLAEKLGGNEAAAVELAIRETAQRQKVG